MQKNTVEEVVEKDAVRDVFEEADGEESVGQDAFEAWQAEAVTLELKYRRQILGPSIYLTGRWIIGGQL